jgi:NAD(P)-dependent dehydrogenase (short-subunit alcohol dehydrogenase family)
MNKYNYKKIFSLESKRVIIIGGLGLIGKEISKALDDLGAEIVIADLIKKSTKRNHKYKYINLDCSKLKKAEQLLKKYVGNYYGASILINCSYPRTKDWYQNTYKDITLSSYENNISIHLNSYVWLSRIFAEELRKLSKSGRIINFSSIYGLVGQDLSIYKKTRMKDNLTYSVIKGGIINFTRQMASCYGKYNILTNCICPGGVLGPVQGLSSKQDKIFLKNYSSKVPIRRLANTTEIASVAAFMCSDAASYINGTSVVVDGGWSSI